MGIYFGMSVIASLGSVSTPVWKLPQMCAVAGEEQPGEYHRRCCNHLDCDVRVSRSIADDQMSGKGSETELANPDPDCTIPLIEPQSRCRVRLLFASFETEEPLKIASTEDNFGNLSFCFSAALRTQRPGM